MKIVLRTLVLFGAVVVATGCGEPAGPQSVPDSIAPAPAPPPSPAPPSGPPSGTLYIAAGRDLLLALPGSSVVLDASAYSPAGIAAYTWTKISGPDAYSIAAPEAKSTAVRGLEAGTYSFEVAAKDKAGVTARDTVRVYVYDASVPLSHELTFEHLGWSCPLECTLDVARFEYAVPPATDIKVFVQRDGTWVPVAIESPSYQSTYFFYNIYSGILTLSTVDGTGFTDVKVVF